MKRKASAQDKSQTHKDKQQADSAADSVVPGAILEAGAKIARTIRAQAVFLYLEALDQPQQLSQLKLGTSELILVVRDQAGAKHAKSLAKRHIMVPPISLTRMGQIKTAVLIAFSQRFLAPGDSFVFLAAPVNGQIDTMVVMNVGKEWEMFQTVDQPELTEHIKRVVFQRVLSLALELASEGREGKPVGALFVIGDHHNVSQYCQQNIINPFKGHDEEHRNILDATMTETIKSFSSLDGAFIVKGSGTIASAGTNLTALRSGEPLPQGLGARHAAAAGITASTKSIAITVSESTGTVRVWRLGQMITEIEKAPPQTARTPSGSIMASE